jgi:hypothetical protein
MNSVVPSITHIVNLCFDTGVFPDTFKISTIHPIYKARKKDAIHNCRLIFVLPALSKIVEKIMNKRLLLHFLESEGLLSQNQYDFRAGRSTADAELR